MTAAELSGCTASMRFLVLIGYTVYVVECVFKFSQSWCSLRSLGRTHRCLFIGRIVRAPTDPRHLQEICRH